MTHLDIIRERFCTQRLAGDRLERPEQVVDWLGAVQSQEVPGARWSLAQRVNGCTEADVNEALDRGTILRTHVLRPTWHFVTQADIRWVLELTGPRVQTAMATYYRKQELDEDTLRRCHDLFTGALQGGKSLTRKELGQILAEAGIETDAFRLSFITLHAELERLICSGPMRGKHHTYMLLDERAPEARSLPYDQALAELTLRFFRSHGPATVRDFRWWSSLKAADARAGVEMVKDQLMHEVVDGHTYWRGSLAPPERPLPPDAYLVPEFDESHIAYQDLRFLLAGPDGVRPGSGVGEVVRPINIAGHTLGNWKHTIAKGRLTLTATLFVPPTPDQITALEAAAERYGSYMNLPASLEYVVAAAVEAG